MISQIREAFKKKRRFFPHLLEPPSLPLKCGKFPEISKRVKNRQKAQKTPFFHTFKKVWILPGSPPMWKNLHIFFLKASLQVSELGRDECADCKSNCWKLLFLIICFVITWKLTWSIMSVNYWIQDLWPFQVLNIDFALSLVVNEMLVQIQIFNLLLQEICLD